MPTRGSSSRPDSTTPRDSIWSRLAESLISRFLGLYEDLDFREWHAFQRILALALSLASNIFLMIFRLHARDDGFSWTEMGFFTASIINIIFLRACHKDYQLFSRPAKEKPNSDHAHLVDVYPRNNRTTDSLIAATLALLLDKFTKKEETNDADDDKIWELRVWNPNTFYISLFSYFPPTNIFIIHSMNTHNWPFLLVALVFTTAQACLLASLYSGYVKDKEVLYAETQIEYDSCFVKRKLFTLKVDANTQTIGEVSWDYLYPKVDNFNVITGIPTGPMEITPSGNGHYTDGLLSSRVIEHPRKTNGHNPEDFTNNPWADVATNININSNTTTSSHVNRMGSDTPRTPTRTSNGTITRNLGRSSRSYGNNNNGINGHHSPNITKVATSPALSNQSSTFTTPTKSEITTRRRKYA